MKTSRFALPAAAALAVALLAPAAHAQAPAAGDATRPPRQVDALKFPKLRDVKAPQVVRERLANGMKLLLVEDHDLPRVSFRAVVRGGKIAEPAGKAGLAELFGEVHRTGGAGTMTGDQMDEFLERLGGEVETGVDDAYGVVSGSTLVEHLDQVLPVFADVVTKPTFAEDKVDLGKTHLRGMIARRNDEVMGIAQRELLKLVYGADSPYARQFEYADLDRLTREDLLGFHRAHYRPDTTILAVWGDFKVADMKARLEKAFGAWTATGIAPSIARPKVTAPPPSVNYIEKKDVEQTFIMAGQLGMRLDDPDYPAVNLMSDILGGGFASRIFVKVRTEKGLAYTAGGWAVPAYDHPGAFFFFTSTKPASTVEALTTVLDEIAKIRAAEVTDDELSRVKDAYLNSYAFEFDSTAKVVSRLQAYEFYGYPADFNMKLREAIEKVSKADVLRVAQTHLDPAKLTILAVGRQDQFDKPLDTVGKVNVIDITIPEPGAAEKLADVTPEAVTKGKALLLKAARTMGEPALKGLVDVTSEGTSSIESPMGPMDLKVKTTFVLPDRMVNEISTPMGAMVQVLDGDAGWIKMGPQSQALPDSALGEMKRGLYTELGCARLLKEALAGTLHAFLLGSADLDGTKVDDVVVALGDSSVHLYFAPASGELLGVKRTTQTEQGPADAVETFAAWQTVSGLRVPFESVQKVGGEVKASSKLTSVKVNAGFAEELFKKPEPK